MSQPHHSKSPASVLEQLVNRFGSFESAGLAVIEAHHHGARNSDTPMTLELARALVAFADDLDNALEHVTRWQQVYAGPLADKADALGVAIAAELERYAASKDQPAA